MGVKGTVYIKTGKEDKKVARTEAREELEKLDTLVEETGTVLYQVTSVFPFQIFPDKVIIDKNKITIVRKKLFFKRIFPIIFEDLKTVKVNRGMVFASLEFELFGYEENPEPITHLWPYEAAKAEQYIIGIIKAKREMIDISKLTTKQVKKRLEAIGKAEEEVEKLF